MLRHVVGELPKALGEGKVHDAELGSGRGRASPLVSQSSGGCLIDHDNHTVDHDNHTVDHDNHTVDHDNHTVYHDNHGMKPLPNNEPNPPPRQPKPSKLVSAHKSNTIETFREKRRTSIDGLLIVNNYLILQELGRGTTAKVKLCQDMHTNQLYAVKVMKKTKYGKMKVANTLLRNKPSNYFGDGLRHEIAIMKKLDHPNVVKLYEVIDDPDSNKLYLILEYVRHGTLMPDVKDPASEVSPIQEPLAREYFVQITHGLEYLHRNNVLHGDLKPSNILLARHHHESTTDKQLPVGAVKICDFGVSEVAESSMNDVLQKSNTTPIFMAPELHDGHQNQSGKQADIWSLGVTLYLMIFGKFPFRGENLLLLADAITTEQLKFPSTNPPVSPQLKDLLSRLLVKDPAERITLDQVIKHKWCTQRPKASSPLGDADKDVARPHSASKPPLPQTATKDRRHSLLSHRSKIRVSQSDVDSAIGSIKRLRSVMRIQTTMAKKLLNVRKSIHRKRNSCEPNPASSPMKDESSSDGHRDESQFSTQILLHAMGMTARSIDVCQSSRRFSEQHFPSLGCDDLAVDPNSSHNLTQTRAIESHNEQVILGLGKGLREQVEQAESSGQSTIPISVEVADRQVRSEFSRRNKSFIMRKVTLSESGEMAASALPVGVDATGLTKTTNLIIHQKQQDSERMSMMSYRVQKHSNHKSRGGKRSPWKRTSTFGDEDDENNSLFDGVIVSSSDEEEGDTNEDEGDTNADEGYSNADSDSDTERKHADECAGLPSGRYAEIPALRNEPTSSTVSPDGGVKLCPSNDGAIEAHRSAIHDGGSPSTSAGEQHPGLDRTIVPQPGIQTFSIPNLSESRARDDAKFDSFGRQHTTKNPAGLLLRKSKTYNSSDEEDSSSLSSDSEMDDDDDSSLGSEPVTLMENDDAFDDVLASHLQATTFNVNYTKAMKRILPLKRDTVPVGKFDGIIRQGGYSRNLGLKFISSERQNKRPYMEDRICCYGEFPISIREESDQGDGSKTGGDEDFFLQQGNETIVHCGLYSVIDGHGGQACAEHVKQRLHQHIRAKLRDTSLAPRRMLYEAYHEMDGEFLAWAEENQSYAGACGVTMMFTSIRRPKSTTHDWTPAPSKQDASPRDDFDVTRHLYMANLGDCRAVLCRSGNAIQLTVDHNPRDAEEKARILEAGGEVMNGRVQGVLSVSRAFGDIEYKTIKDEAWGNKDNPKAHFSADIVSADPYLYDMKVHEFDEFLLLASDGLYDGLSNQQAVDLVRKNLCLGKDLSMVCEALVEEASQLSSKGDNISCVIVMFEERVEPYQRRSSTKSFWRRTSVPSALSLAEAQAGNWDQPSSARESPTRRYNQLRRKSDAVMSKKHGRKWWKWF